MYILFLVFLNTNLIFSNDSRNNIHSHKFLEQQLATVWNIYLREVGCVLTYITHMKCDALIIYEQRVEPAHAEEHPGNTSFCFTMSLLCIQH